MLLNLLSGPWEADIQRVMAETGMQHVQARNHLIGRDFMIRQIERERALRTWGGSVSNVTRVRTNL